MGDAAGGALGTGGLMVAYSFHADFIGPILSGRKTSTIRPDGKRRHARAGELLQLYVGMRTPDCVRLLQAPCTRAVPIEIHGTHVVAGGVRKVNPEFTGRWRGSRGSAASATRRPGLSAATGCRRWGSPRSAGILLRQRTWPRRWSWG